MTPRITHPLLCDVSKLVCVPKEFREVGTLRLLVKCETLVYLVTEADDRVFTYDYKDKSKTLVELPCLAGRGVLKIVEAEGGLVTLALCGNGQVYAWGGDTDMVFSLLGVPGVRYSSDAVLVELPEPALDIAIGTTNSFAVGVSGKLYVWGLDTTFILDGNPEFAPIEVPEVHPKFENVVEFKCDEYQAMVLQDDGRVFFWRHTDYEQLAEIVRRTSRGDPARKEALSSRKRREYKGATNMIKAIAVGTVYDDEAPEIEARATTSIGLGITLDGNIVQCSAACEHGVIEMSTEKPDIGPSTSGKRKEAAMFAKFHGERVLSAMLVESADGRLWSWINLRELSKNRNSFSLNYREGEQGQVLAVVAPPLDLVGNWFANGIERKQRQHPKQAQHDAFGVMLKPLAEDVDYYLHKKQTVADIRGCFSAAIVQLDRSLDGAPSNATALEHKPHSCNDNLSCWFMQHRNILGSSLVPNLQSIDPEHLYKIDQLDLFQYLRFLHGDGIPVIRISEVDKWYRLGMVLHDKNLKKSCIEILNKMLESVGNVLGPEDIQILRDLLYDFNIQEQLPGVVEILKKVSPRRATLSRLSFWERVFRFKSRRTNSMRTPSLKHEFYIKLNLLGELNNRFVNATDADMVFVYGEQHVALPRQMLIDLPDDGFARQVLATNLQQLDVSEWVLPFGFKTIFNYVYYLYTERLEHLPFDHLVELLRFGLRYENKLLVKHIEDVIVSPRIPQESLIDGRNFNQLRRLAMNRPNMLGELRDATHHVQFHKISAVI